MIFTPVISVFAFVAPLSIQVEGKTVFYVVFALQRVDVQIVVGWTANSELQAASLFALNALLLRRIELQAIGFDLVDVYLKALAIHQLFLLLATNSLHRIGQEGVGITNQAHVVCEVILSAVLHLGLHSVVTHPVRFVLIAAGQATSVKEVMLE